MRPTKMFHEQIIIICEAYKINEMITESIIITTFVILNALQAFVASVLAVVVGRHCRRPRLRLNYSTRLMVANVRVHHSRSQQFFCFPFSIERHRKQAGKQTDGLAAMCWAQRRKKKK